MSQKNGASEKETLIEETPIQTISEKSEISWSFYLLALFLICISSSNSVAGKIVSVPYGNYSFFLGLWNSLAYVLVYFVILGFRLIFKITSIEQIKHVWMIQPKTEKDVGIRGFLRRIPQVKYFLAMV